MPRIASVSTFPVHYRMEVSRTTCESCKRVRETHGLFEAKAVDGSTGVQLVPVKPGAGFLWDLPIRTRIVEAKTAYCDACVGLAPRRPLPDNARPLAPQASNWLPPKAARGGKAAAPSAPPTLADLAKGLE